MKKVTWLILLALVLGGVAAFGTFQVQQQADTRALSKFATTQVLITNTAIPAQTTFADAVATGLAQYEKYPTQYLPASAVLESAPLNGGLVAQADIPAGQVVLSGDFGVTVSTSQSLAVPKGYVAMTLTLPAESRVGGYLQPGKHVAVFATSGTTGNDTSKASTRLVFSSLQVLAVGANTVSGVSLSAQADTTQNQVTLAVPPASAQTFINASHSSAITLVLISNGTIVSPAATN